MEFNLPLNVDFIIRTLQSHGYEAYAVGGCVRDTLIGRKPNDWDITTSAMPLQVKELFKKTIDTGLKHGTVTVMLNGIGYEVTTYRIDGDYNDCRHPESVTFTSNLSEDLRRRDFTINAFVYNNEDGIIDLFHGMDDLENKIIRCVGEPEERFTEDALRILRAVRFAAQLHFTIDEATKNAATKLAPNLQKVSAERIHVELEKLLVSAHPDYIKLLCTLGLDKYVLPSLYELSKTSEELDRLCNALCSSPRNKYVRWAILASFISLDHDNPCETAKEIMRRLKSDNFTIDYITKFISLRDYDLEHPNDYDLRVLLNLLVDKDYRLYIDFMKSHYLFSSSALQPAQLDVIAARLENILNQKDCIFIKQLAVNGRDLITAGLPQGKELGNILESLLDMVMKDQSLNTSDKLLALALQIYSQ